MTDKNPFAAARRLARRTALLLTPPVYSLVNAAPAFAAGGTAVGAIWLGVSDSANVPIGSYGLSLNNGSLTDPTAAPSALSMHWLYGLYQSIIGFTLWLPDYALSLRWLNVISGPFEFMGTQLTAMVHSPAVLLLVGFIAASVIAINVALGKVGRAAAQTTVAILMAYLAVAVGSRPVSEAVGPSGVLALGRDIAVESISELSGKSLAGDQAVQELNQQLADHYARTPTLVWNFGADLDAAPYNCGAVWSTAITTGPIDKVKDAVEKGCPDGEALHEYAMSDPDSRKTVAFSSILFAVTMLLVHGCESIIAIVLGIATIIWLLVAIVALVIGWIPGANQTLAIKAGLGAVACFAGMTLMFALIGITGLLVAALFGAVGGDVAVAMPMVVVLTVALFVGLLYVRKSLAERRKRAVQAVQRFTDGASEPGNTQGQPPGPSTTQNVTRLTRSAVKTGVKHGITVIAPEAAPFLAAGDHLQHRINARQLKQGKRAGGKKSAAAPSYDVTPTAYEPPVTAETNPRITTVNYSTTPEPSAAAYLDDAPDHSTTPAQQARPAGTTPAPHHKVVTTARAASPSQRYNPADPRPAATSPTLAGPAAEDPYSSESRQQPDLLCGAKTTRGARCLQTARSCPDHSPDRSTQRIHPVIAQLARQIADYQRTGGDVDDASQDGAADIKGHLMARGRTS